MLCYVDDIISIRKYNCYQYNIDFKLYLIDFMYKIIDSNNKIIKTSRHKFN